MARSSSITMLSSQQPLSKQNLPPLYLPKLSLFTRVSYAVQLWFLKLGISLALKMRRTRKPIPASSLPTLSKSYPVRPTLPNRIFFPPNWKSGDQKLPLYLNIHGGGFAILDPEVDDMFCAIFASRYNMIVASVNYTKPPIGFFPGPSHDIAAICAAVIDDPALPIDKNRVAIAGFSTGGNLALSAAQLPDLKGRLQAVVPWYPEIDLTTPMSEKQKTRPIKPGVPEEKDVLSLFAHLFDWSYIPEDQDLRDPLLSVNYAAKEDLPKWVYFVGAEYDMLAAEGREMCTRLGGMEGVSEGSEEWWQWEKGTVKYTRVRGANHGFTHHKTQQGEEEKFRLSLCESIYPQVGDWLLNGPFKK